MSETIDVIVLGAGLAGLGAAEKLSAAGKSVRVLEARERTGGRVWTTHDVHTAHPVELGAEWVEAEGHLRTVLDHEHADVRVAGGHRLERLGVTIARDDESQGEMDSLVSRVAAEVATGDDRTLLDVLDSLPHGTYSMDTRHELLGYVAGYHAADPARVSARWLAQVEETEPADASEGRALRGLDRAVDALVTRLRSTNAELQLGAVVRDVQWQDGHVTVEADVHGHRETMHATALVCTLPLAILKLSPTHADAVRFSPPLNDKQQALTHLEMGEARKIVLLFHEPIWLADTAMRDALFLFDYRQPIPTWWTTNPLELPILTGWLAGPAASRAADADAEQLLSMCVESLTGALDFTPTHIRESLRAWHSHDWSADPFAHGAYSYVLAGGVDAPGQLARPINRTLYFAGEATCAHGHNATMEGALSSGYRAATELLAGE